MESKYKNILIAYSEKRTPKHKKTLQKVQDILSENDIHHISKNINNITHTDQKNNQLIICVGGDGTFIRASHHAIDIPILGINSESNNSQGFLCTLSETNIEKLINVLESPQTKQLPRIQITLNGKPLPHLAINEVYIGAESQFSTSKYTISNQNTTEEQRSSGVLVVTSTGSTAWYASAGEEPFTDPRTIKFLVREPYTSNIFTPKLINEEVNQSIDFTSKMWDNGIIAIDSNQIYTFDHNNKVSLALVDTPLNILTL
ncbi:MAG: NAD kinase [Patescibacteria group bacterium]|jgi:NAD kinase